MFFYKFFIRKFYLLLLIVSLPVFSSTNLSFSQSSQVISKSGITEKTKDIYEEPWFNKDLDYLKIFTKNDGIFRVDFSLISNYVENISAINPETFKVYNKGKQIPIFVEGETDGSFDQGDFIEFVVRRHCGENSYYDLFSKYNVYWLTWSGDKGERVTLFNSYPDVQLNKGDYFLDTLHYEKENYYHEGSDWSETQNTLFTEGERRYTNAPLFAGQSFTMKFNLNDIEYSAKEIVTLQISLRGIKFSENQGVQHHIEFYFNENYIGERKFSGFNDTLFVFYINTDMLIDGENILKVAPVKTSTELDVILIDWFEVVYPRLYKFKDGSLIFQTPQNGSKYIELSNLSSQDAAIFSLSGGIRFTNFIYDTDGNKYKIKLNLPIDSNNFLAAEKSSFITSDEIKRVNFQDLSDSKHNAEYIIISHKDFIESANNLADYRRAEISTKVIEIEEIYNEFNYGIPNPYAIRDFFIMTYSDWSLKPDYAVLIGDANNYYWSEQNFIPSFGYPCSDSWYVCVDSKDDIIPDIVIGRIPCKTLEEANNYIEKLIEYESKGFEHWNKNVIFLNGGKNDYERNKILSYSNGLISNHIGAPPYGGNVKSYNKTTDTEEDYTYTESIINDINEGILILNSFGHAAHNRFDINFGHYTELQNKEKYPLMVSWGCRTGQYNAEQINSAAENYTLVGDKGSIAYIGISGWGNIQIDGFFSNWFYNALFRETTYRPAVALKAAKDSLGNSSFQGTLAMQNTIFQYNFIGDPYLKLKVPDKSDFALVKEPSTDIQFPTESTEILNTGIYITNYGILPYDSVSLKIKTVNPEQNEEVSYQKYLPGSFIDKVEFPWQIDGIPGEHTLEIYVDSDLRFTELDETNNLITINKRVYKESLIIEKPMNFSVIKNNNVELVTMFPKNLFSQKGTVYFEVDTSTIFSNPLIQSGPIEEGEIITTYNVALEYNRKAYIWRARIYKDGEYSYWTYGNFFTDFNDEIDGDFYLSNNLFSFCSGENVIIEDKVVLDNNFININVNSAGFEDGNAVSMSINNQPIKIEYYDSTVAVPDIGIGMAVLDSNGSIIKTAMFNTYSYPSHNDAMIEFIDSVDEGMIVLAGIKDTGARYLNRQGREALKRIGSAYADSIRFRQSWAIIGRKGAQEGAVTEGIKPRGEGNVSLFDSLFVFFNLGKITSPNFKGINRYSNIKWKDKNVVFLASGLNKNTNQWEVLKDTLRYSGICDISDIETQTYRKVKFTAVLKKFNNSSPILEEFSISAQKSGDAVTNFQLIDVKKDTVLEGDKINITTGVYNSGFSSYDSLDVNIKAFNSNRELLTEKTRVLYDVPPDSTKSINFELDTRGFQNKITVTVEIDPENKVIELSDENNFGTGYFYIKKDLIIPSIFVTIDGKKILTGDFIASEPEILAEITDNSNIGVIDTNLIKILMNGKKVSFSSDEISFNYISNDKKAEIRYLPKLERGKHNLRIEFSDLSGNSSVYEIEFRVETELKIINLYNYPNPFKNDTYFTFVLTQPAEYAQIKIYTTFGRLIKEIEKYNLPSGFNKIYWNGSDEDGDKPANNVYLYKVIIQNGDDRTSSLGKLVIMR